MKKETIVLDEQSLAVITLNTAVVGSGAAGFNAALRLHKLGCTDIALVTEGMNVGTSRNTGSDKQTYYKLTLCGNIPDSPQQMAQDLFDGHGVDGDTAMAEAALSVPCFLQLAELGVPFPVNRYGEYVGYKTDHDPRARATSAGPLTSRLMTEQLEQAVKEREIPVFDRCQVISFIKQGERVVGLLALDLRETGKEEPRFVLFNCRNVVYATGGPAGIYADSVFPYGHSGSSGIAFEAGAKGKNLTEWQYGLASTHPRWNVSGTYMQVLPRFVSVDKEGREREFLPEYFADEGACLSMVFQKGYEWPFDSRRVMNGSSIIDLLVYRERVLRGRRVYLDFRSNPYGREELDYSLLSEEALAYLTNAQACFGTPLERLLHMNAPAYELYLSKGVDLKTDKLEIALCAQHHNGGLDVDLWWQTSLKGLYAAGEVAGTHGVYRPGGSALNAGQVGSLRAAQHIAMHGQDPPLSTPDFLIAAQANVQKHWQWCSRLMSREDNCTPLTEKVQRRMSAVGGALRTRGAIREACAQLREEITHFVENVQVNSPAGLARAYRLRDILLTQRVILSAMADYLERGGGSRGSALYVHGDGQLPAGLDESFRFAPDNAALNGQVQEVRLDKGECIVSWREVRPLPEDSGFFENVWREYRIDKNIR